MPNQKTSAVRHTAYGLFLLVLVLLQSVPGLIPSVGGALPVLVLPFVVTVGVFERELAGAAFGLAAGLLMDLFSPHVGGFNAVSLMIIGCVCGLFVSYLLTVTLRSALLLFCGASVLYFTSQWLIYYVFKGYERPFYYLYQYQLPSFLYTLLFLIPIYYFVRMLWRRMTGRAT